MAALASYLKDIFSTGKGADVTLEVGSGEERVSISAHSLVLRRSMYFEAALASEFKEGLTNKFTIDDVKPIHFSRIVESLYTDVVSVPPEATEIEVLEIMALCRRFEIPMPIPSSLLPAVQSQVVLGKNAVRLMAKAYDLDLQDAADSILDTVTVENIRFKMVKEEVSMTSSQDIASEASFVKARIALCSKFSDLLNSLVFPKPAGIRISSYHGQWIKYNEFTVICDDRDYFQNMCCFINKVQKNMLAASHQLLEASQFASPPEANTQGAEPPTAAKTDAEEDDFWMRNTRPPVKRRRRA